MLGPCPGTGSIDSMLCFYVDGGQVWLSRLTGHVKYYFTSPVSVYQACEYLFDQSYFVSGASLVRKLLFERPVNPERLQKLGRSD